MSPPQRRLELSQAAGLGVRWLRLPLRWTELEPRRGEVDWRALDDVLFMAASGRFKVLLSVYTSPAWSRRDPPPPAAWWLCDDAAIQAPGSADSAPPTDPRDLAAFLALVAARYQDRIAAIELWREPNRLPAWRVTGPDPEDYARLLTATASTLRRAAPSWRIVSAGLAPVQTAASPVCFRSDLVYLDRLAATGALELVDAVGVQVPGLEAGAMDPPAEDALNFRRAERHRAILLRRGLADMPLWILAAGWRVSADSHPSPWGAWPPEAAAAELSTAWVLYRRSWPWAGPFILIHPAPGLADDDPRQGYGLWLTGGGRRGLTTLGRAVEAISATPMGPGEPLLEEDAESVALPQHWPALPGGLAAAAGLALLLGWRPRWRVIRAGSGLTWRPHPTATWPALAARFEAMGHGWRTVWIALALVVANALLPPAMALVSLMVLVLVACWSPVAILTVAAATLPWRDVLRLQVLTRPVLPLEGLLLLVGIGWLARRLLFDPAPAGAAALDRRAVERRHDLGLVLLLCGWGAVASAAAQAARPAWFEWRTVIVEPAVFFLFLRAWARPWPALRQVLQGLVGGAAVAALGGLVGMALSQLAASGMTVDSGLATAVAAEGVLRARGPYGSPNNLALWLGRALPLAVATAFDSGTVGRRSRYVAWAAALLIGLGLLATFSRGSWVLGLPALAAVAVLAWRKQGQGRRTARTSDLLASSTAARAPRVFLVIATTAALLLLVPLLGSERLRGTLSLAPGSTAYIRWRLWQSSAELIGDHPWTGVGPDNFLVAYRDTYVRRDVLQERSLSHPHNLFLDWAARLGLPGLLIGFLLVGGTLRALLRTTAAPELGGDRYRWAWGLVGMQVYALAHGLVDNHFFLVDLAAGQWLLLAAARSLGDEVNGAYAPSKAMDRRA